MNCHDFNTLLDADLAGELSREQRVAMDQHLATCRVCSEEFANWRDMAAMPVPSAPADLRARVAVAIGARRAARHRPGFRPYLVGGVLVVTAAAAAGLAWKQASADRLIPLHAVAPGQRTSEALEALDPPQARSAGAQMETGAVEPPAAAMEAESALRPLRFVVLIRPEDGADAQSVARITQCHDAVVSQLRQVAPFEVMADGAVLPHQGPVPFLLSESDGKLARTRGASHVLLITTMHGCSAGLFDGRTGDLISGPGGQLLPDGDWRPSATRLVQGIREKLLESPDSLWESARATLLDKSLSDGERSSALWRLSQYKGGAGHHLARSAVDDSIIAAAVELGLSSSNADVRQSIWAVLRAVDDPQLIRPLLTALANDPDSSVRMQAAYTLKTFQEAPGVREALQRAAAEDPDSEPTTVCCLDTVREAAERASVRDRDFGNWARSKLHDESLPARSRLMPVLDSTMDGRMVLLSEVDWGVDAARVVYEIGLQSMDPGIRQMAWGILNRAKPDESFVPGLLRDLTGHPDEYVRANAAKVLSRHTGLAQVREAMDRAQSDPSMQVRIVANAATSAGN